MRVLKNAWFQRFARKEKISDAALCDAVARAGRGQVDADLGGGVLKQRIARPGKGKSGGYRTILFFRAGERSVFVYGFAKSDRDNIHSDEENAFKKAATYVLALSDAELDALMAEGHFVEVQCDEEKLQE